MRYAPDRKDTSRKEILEKAALRLCGDGIEAVGVRTLMSDAGLTHGAFYAHFGSRADLVAAAISESLEETGRKLRVAVEAADEGEGLSAFIDAYLRMAHRKRMDKGCAAAALSPEVARQDIQVRRRFMEGVDAISRLLAGQLPEGGTEDERFVRAGIVFASLMGTLQLSRTITDVARAERQLAAGRSAAMAIACQPWG